MNFIAWFQQLPSSDLLAPHLKDQRYMVRDQIEAVRAGREVATGLTMKAVYAERYKQRGLSYWAQHFQYSSNPLLCELRLIVLHLHESA